MADAFMSCPLDAQTLECTRMTGDRDRLRLHIVTRHFGVASGILRIKTYFVVTIAKFARDGGPMRGGSIAMYTCRVCFFEGMTEPPQDCNICECCGTEFGNDDEDLTYEELRARWIASGAKWFFGEPPIGWNPRVQARVFSHP